MIRFDLGHLLRPDVSDQVAVGEAQRFVEAELLADVKEIIATLRAEGELGTVKFFREDLGYGYITTQDRRDVFVHASGVVGEGFRSLEPGTPVRFKRRVGTRSIEAFDVRPECRER